MMVSIIHDAADVNPAWAVRTGLVGQMKESRNALIAVFTHLTVLAAKPIQMQYENPGDSANGRVFARN